MGKPGSWQLMRAVRLPTHFTVPTETHCVTVKKPIKASTSGLRRVPDGDSPAPGKKPVFLPHAACRQNYSQTICPRNRPDPSHTLQNSGGRYQGSQLPILLSMKAVRKPATVISPARVWATSNASGIMVSTSIARMAPAAMAVVAATTSGENPWKT